jgi:hypothetical protein
MPMPDCRIRANIGSEASMSSAKIAIQTEKAAARDRVKNRQYRC